jgi:death-on-curing protein
LNYLTAEQVLFIHARLMAETSGDHGVLELGLRLSAVARPQVTFNGPDLYLDRFSKAAALFETLVGDHAILDGNKRTAIASAGLFLPNYVLKPTAKPVEI